MDQYCYETLYFCDFSGGGGPDPLSPSASTHGVTVLCPRARHFNRCLILVKPRKTRYYPDMTEKLFTGTQTIIEPRYENIFKSCHILLP